MSHDTETSTRRHTRSDGAVDGPADGMIGIDYYHLVDKYAIQSMRRLATSGTFAIRDNEKLEVIVRGTGTPSPEPDHSHTDLDATTTAPQATSAHTPHRPSSVTCPDVVALAHGDDGSEPTAAFELPADKFLQCDHWERTGVLPDYDMDSDDEEWLDDYNGERKTTRTARLQPHALELAMAFTLGGRAHDLEQFDEISHHVSAIVAHTEARLTKDGRARLLPSTVTPATAASAIDDERVAPYECFVPYDINDEPMAALPRTPRSRPNAAPIKVEWPSMPKMDTLDDDNVDAAEVITATDKAKTFLSPPRRRATARGATKARRPVRVNVLRLSPRRGSPIKRSVARRKVATKSLITSPQGPHKRGVKGRRSTRRKPLAHIAAN
eukprot:m.184543 g.184543  ORF g.184543 m.184543 type:complete len:382 (+) comp16168_c0_seq1:480-1625(+)